MQFIELPMQTDFGPPRLETFNLAHIVSIWPSATANNCGLDVVECQRAGVRCLALRSRARPARPGIGIADLEGGRPLSRRTRRLTHTPEEHPMHAQHHTAPRSPALAAPPASFPSAATARLALENLRLARRERDDATAAACLAVMEAYDTGKPVQRHVLDAAMRLHLADAR